MAIAHPRWTANETPHARILKIRSTLGGELTAREAEVLRNVCWYGGPDAADRLGIEEQTIKNHLSNVYRKLGIGDRSGGKIGLACYRLGEHDARRGEPR